MLYLIRHADAVTGPIDEQRYLSTYGEAQVKALGAVIKKKEMKKPDVLWHSTLLRAKQTALRLCKESEWNIPILETDDLKPDDDCSIIFKKLKSETRHIAIVGHNPFLECLSSRLLKNESVVFEKAACLILEKNGNEPLIEWKIITHFSADSLTE
jgi:phosphohistidine phosphatase